MGGGTSLVAVGEGRLHATALVLVDIAPRIEKQGVDKIHAFMRQKPGGFASLEEVADAIAAYQPQRPRPKSLDGLSKNVRLGSDGKYRWHWDPRFLEGKRDMRQRERRFAVSARNIRIPTLLVRGALSDLLSEEGARAFLELAPHSEYVSVAGAAHMVAGDRNDIFGSSGIEFLARAVPPGAAAPPDDGHYGYSMIATRRFRHAEAWGTAGECKRRRSPRSPEQRSCEIRMHQFGSITTSDRHCWRRRRARRFAKAALARGGPEQA